MKTYLLLNLAFVLLVISGCQNTSKKIGVTESKDSVAETSSQKKIISFDDLENANQEELANREWDLPPRLKESWSQAKELNYKDTLQLDQISDKFLINFTVLTKDSSNFIIKNFKITALASNPKYYFSSLIFDQFNMGTRNAYNMGVTAVIQAQLKSGVVSVNKLYAKMYSIVAKEGVIKPL